MPTITSRVVTTKDTASTRIGGSFGVAIGPQSGTDQGGKVKQAKCARLWLVK